MRQIVIFNSPENAAFHEAGHALTALAVGATVVEMELYLDPIRAYGRTRTNRTREQARHIALGGFAAEYLLYIAGRLVKQDGTAPSESEFIDHAYRNAARTLRRFGSTTQAPLNRRFWDLPNWKWTEVYGLRHWAREE